MPIKYVPFIPEPVEGQAVLGNFNRILKYRGADDVSMTLQRGMPLYEMEKQETVGENADGNIVCGFYRSRTHDVICMDNCLIQDKDAFVVAKDKISEAGVYNGEIELETGKILQDRQTIDVNEIQYCVGDENNKICTTDANMAFSYKFFNEGVK